MLDGHADVTLQPMALPFVHGVARLATMLYAGDSFGDLLDLLGPEPPVPADRAAWLMDRSWAFSLNFAPYQAAQLQQRALATHQLFRVRGGPAAIRLLALAAPGDLMVNAPLDFLTGPAALRLDLAYLGPDLRLPQVLPEHDVAIVAASQSAPDALAAFGRVFGAWPRPILNDPARIQPLSRPYLPRCLADLPGLLTAPCREVSRSELESVELSALLPGSVFPYLLRPPGSHAGQGLVRIDAPRDLVAALADREADGFTLTQFIDYRAANGWYAKHRIAFVAGRPFLCHMASSEHWMVHFLNAGMDTDPAKRAAEAAAMAGFDEFTRRHAAGLEALAAAIGLDYFSADCAEEPDGRLLVFEVDTAAILHSMDDPALYPYKRATMQRCYEAFAAMLRDRTAPAPRSRIT